MAKLTAKQQAFVREYIVDNNATQAAIRAGYSEHTAKEQGSRLLTKVHIARAVSKAQDERARRTEVTADRVVLEYARLAFSDISDLVTIEGGAVKVRDTAELTEDQRVAISEISETSSGMRIKAHSKTVALEALGKHLGMFIDRQETGGPGEFANLTEEELEDRVEEKLGRIKLVIE